MLCYNNARPHIAEIIQQNLQDVKLPVLRWPAQSPDINPIEHVWDHLRQALKRHQEAFRNFEDVEDVLLQEWKN